MQRLTALPLRGPGRFGLNTSQAADTADPRWALELTNGVFDDAGRIAARKGLNYVTTGVPHEDETDAIFEYVKDRTTKEIISATPSEFWRGTTTLTDVTGTTTPSAGNWQFVNFNGKCIGVQQGETAVQYSGTSFSDLAAEGMPKGNCILSAWGHLWVGDEDQKGITICDLLDEQTWTLNINLQEYWPDGEDLVIALAQWQDRLLVFGERSIMIFSEPQTIGDITPVITLSDIIDSGCVSRDAVTAVGNDMIYLSREGLRSINRAIEYESLPSSIVSTNVRDRLVEQLDSTPLTKQIKIAYSEVVGGIIAKIGVSYWYFDVKLPLETGDLRASQWDHILFNSLWAATDGTVYFGALESGVGIYEGYTDSDGPQTTSFNYILRYRGTWAEADGREFIPKTARVSLITSTQTTITFNWAFEFEDALRTQTATTGTTEDLAQWNVDEWNNAEWQAGGFQVRRPVFRLSGAGERFQPGLQIPVEGAISIAQIDLYTKVGRMAA